MDFIQLLNDFDTSLLLTLNGPHNDFWDTFMVMFTGKMIWVPMYAAMVYMIFGSYKWRQALLYIICVALTITICDQLCGHFVRNLVMRPRPSGIDNPISSMVYFVEGHRGHGYGFPSCHAANSFGLATIITLILRERRFAIFIFAWAFLNSWSRLYLAYHYPGDLIVGALCGIGAAYLVYYAVRWISCRLPYDWRFSPRKRMAGFRPSDAAIIVGLATVVYIIIIATSAA